MNVIQLDLLTIIQLPLSCGFEQHHYHSINLSSFGRASEHWYGFEVPYIYCECWAGALQNPLTTQFLEACLTTPFASRLIGTDAVLFDSWL